MRSFSNLREAIALSINTLAAYGALVEPGRWQGTNVRDKPEMQPFEMMNLAWTAPVQDRLAANTPGIDLLQHLRVLVKPNLPWADDHFEERVGRVPSNPGDQYMNWPHWRGGHLDEGGRFTHTYQERIWPRRAGWTEDQVLEVWKHETQHEGKPTVSNFGIHYRYGDLDDVVDLLIHDPYTRQAYLPIFFPEDTGAHHGGRVPCTLGYHFMLRNNRLHIWYTIRSCDAVRHFRDDVYLACRLLLWVLDELRKKENTLAYQDYRYQTDPPPWGQGKSEGPEPEDLLWPNVQPGNITFHAYSFHCFRGDLHALRSR